ncbi:carbon-nitrogen hydrolase family protein [Seohaeicola zhoushanensis]|uniref:Carbon-nitrogen hydrolase n=1 Tax=Seohaeicola zhoushanensis TaxID=1569283 RepID=A0A8J3M9U8_9RHOB|nr:carbon-nitrogen hydrolase family protein [Seohaeicola zhoushanensis]GHF68943.1 carbon-nitrogen hydrolase [Seohaeicola zhoushanensis]
MKIAVIQTEMGLSPDETLPRAEAAMTRAMEADERPDFLLLPEYFSYYGLDNDSARALATPLEEAPAYRMAQTFAARHGVVVQAGTILARIEGDERVENVSVVFDRKGEVLASYRKIHLFDVDDLGSGAYRESDYIRPGNEVVTWQLDGVTFGTAICFDIRFPEMFRELRLRGAQVITFPAAFTLETGAAHWSLLTRARAVETQCHLVACGLGGSVTYRDQKKACFGNSAIIDPWGRKLAQAGQGSELLAATLDLDEQAELRRRMPIISQRRLAFGWDPVELDARSA